MGIFYTFSKSRICFVNTCSGLRQEIRLLIILFLFFRRVISLVHRIKRKKERKREAACEYKTHFKNLVVQLKTTKKEKTHSLLSV